MEFLGGDIPLNWKVITAGISIGLGIGFFISKASNKNRILPAELVLDEVKLAFKQIGKIDGSWMQMTPENYHSDNNPIIYRGGITRTIEGKREQIEFIADAYSGKIVQLHLI